jgi:hypothetical protein
MWWAVGLYTNVHFFEVKSFFVCQQLWPTSYKSEGNMLSTKRAGSEGPEDVPKQRAGELIETVTCPNCQSRIPAQIPDANEGEKQKTLPRSVLFVIAVVCGLYLVMPTLGIFELIPDAIPLIGSLDEAGATAGLLFAAGGLGWLDFLGKR